MNFQLLPSYLVFSLLLLISTFANAATEYLLPPQQVIETTSISLLTKLKEPGFSNNKAEVRHFVDTVIFPHVDAVRMSALVLGKHWKKASTQQKKEFITAFKNLLINTYASTFTEQFNDWKITYLPLQLKASDKKSTVKTIVSQQGLADAKIDYSMILRNEQWKIFDMKVEGISLVISSRESFSDMIKKLGSLDAVIEELNNKN